jgi:predicted transcriptional regulator
MSPAELLAIIGQVKASLDPPAPPPLQKPDTAAILASIKPYALISFENGKSYTMLKRHLAHCGLTVEEYKEKWGLPDNYPIAAPAYSALRSQMAKAQGLGRNGQPKPWKSSSKTRAAAAAQMSIQGSTSAASQRTGHA